MSIYMPSLYGAITKAALFAFYRKAGWKISFDERHRLHVAKNAEGTAELTFGRDSDFDCNWPKGHWGIEITLEKEGVIVPAPPGFIAQAKGG